jgi:pyruvate,orthophosphate dikinase
MAKTKAAKKTSKPAKTSSKNGKSPKSNKFIYFFGKSKCDGDGKMKPLLGGKGANLAAMTRIGLPVPPGFTITTEVCTYYYANGKKYPPALPDDVKKAIAWLEKETGKKFGDAKNPLLVSVRSGARDSMPGMMDTILNLGLNDETTEGLSAATNNGRFAWDSYRRFVQMYGDVVMGVQKRHENEPEPFEEVMDHLKHEVGVEEDTALSEDNLRELVKRYKQLIKDRTSKAFPTDPFKQLEGAVGAVFGSWMNDRAILYRQKYRIPDEWGTAVNVQSMVFGNMGNDCATGVAFTRDPATGENVFWGEYLVNAQGEDVVAGVRTPNKISEMEKDPIIGPAYKELVKVRKTLEKNFGDVQDFEFTVERKKLYMLQTRNGKRTALAYVRIAHDMVKEKLMTPEHAIASGDPEALNQLLQPIFDKHAYEQAKQEGRLMATGLAAGPGAASGKVVFTAAKAEELTSKGEHVVLARIETSPEDLRGMIAADGILTCRGGVSSHAALVARQMGKVCVAGAGGIQIDYETGRLICDGVTLHEGDSISINGSTGEVFRGPIATADSELKQVLIGKTLAPEASQVYQYYAFIMKLADKYRTLGIRTNADQPDQVVNAIAFGAEGIGLCRTEHMFFEGQRIDAMRQTILYAGEYAALKKEMEKAEKERNEHKLMELRPSFDAVAAQFKGGLAALLPYQQGDFEGIFRALDGRPACIRLLDPPLHEFLPHEHMQQDELARKLNVPIETVSTRVNELHEFNPMLGNRGCRLGICYPEVTEMQARAIFQAAAKVLGDGIKVKPEVMVPLVGFKKELDLQVAIVHRVAKEVMKETGKKFAYDVGTMIEVPRGALTADEIAETAEFFSFGTNDLTQTCLGMSRDDSGSFLGAYQDAEIIKTNPFASIDATGVGQLMEIGVERGRRTRKDLKIGICGEHGGDPSSVRFCHGAKLNYVSCSPFRVPIARLAAAQAAISDGAE